MKPPVTPSTVPVNGSVRLQNMAVFGPVKVLITPVVPPVDRPGKRAGESQDKVVAQEPTRQTADVYEAARDVVHGPHVRIGNRPSRSQVISGQGIDAPSAVKQAGKASIIEGKVICTAPCRSACRYS